jgi:hypothetical protein
MEVYLWLKSNFEKFQYLHVWLCVSVCRSKRIRKINFIVGIKKDSTEDERVVEKTKVEWL